MKLLLIGLRFMALGLVFILMGCAGDDGGSSSGLYSLKYSFTNSSGSTVTFNGKDVTGNEDTNVSVAAGASNTGSTSALYKTSSVTIVVTVYNAAGTAITNVPVNRVHAANNKTTYIYATYDGSMLNVDATRPAGVSR